MYSRGSEDAGSRSEGSTDSKSSLEAGGHEVQPHHSHQSQQTHHYDARHMLAHGLDALATLRKHPVQTIASTFVSKVSKRQPLYRASSVPTRGPELNQQTLPPRRHEATQSQQPSLDNPDGASISEQPGEFHLVNRNFIVTTVPGTSGSCLLASDRPHHAWQGLGLFAGSALGDRSRKLIDRESVIGNSGTERD